MAIIRKEYLRRICFQGPEEWVRRTADRQIVGTIQVGSGRFISSVTLDARDMPTEEMIPTREDFNEENHDN